MMRLGFHVAYLPVTMLAACSAAPEPSAGSVGLEAISCAIGNAADFADECTVERIERDEETLLLVRHKNGGFRTFQISPNEGGLVTADGADEAVVKDEGSNVLVTVDTDRYRIPVGKNGADAPAG